MQDVIIWWLSQMDKQIIDQNSPTDLPEYIMTELQSLCGGQLWINGTLGEVATSAWDDENPVCQLITNLNAGGIVVRTEDVPRLPKVGFMTTCDYQSAQPNSSIGLVLYFDDAAMGHKQLCNLMWSLIFGTFEIDTPGKWLVEAYRDGSAVRIYHPDTSLLDRLAESFVVREYSCWEPERHVKAQQALLKLLLS